MQKRRTDIQALRALAVVAVFMFHLNEAIAPFGYLGVDIFFVISGYVISLGIIRAHRDNKAFSATAFLLRRIQRLMPALLATVIGTSLLAALFLSPGQLESFSFSAIYALAGLANIHFFSEFSYFSAPLAATPLLHTWSLSLEEQFYFLFALAGWLTLRNTRRDMSRFVWFWLVAGTLSACFVLTADDILALVYDPSADDYHATVDSFLFYQLPSRIYQLSLGILLACLSFSPWLQRLPEAVCRWTGVGGPALLALICVTGSEAIINSNAAVSLLTGAILIARTRTPRSSSTHMHRLEPLRKAILAIGDRSYSIYLVHWPVIALWSLMVTKPQGVIHYLILTVATALGSWALYRHVERYGKSQYMKSAPSGASPFFIYGLILTTASLAFAADHRGLPARLGERVALFESINAGGTAFHEAYYGGGNCERDSICAEPDAPDGRLFLVGDSHARQYASALIETLDSHIIQSIDLRCGVTGANLCKSHEVSDSNVREKRNFVSNIQCRENDVVAIGQRWQLRNPYLNFVTGKELNLATADHVFVAVDNFIQTLEGCRVVLLGRVPESAGSNAEACMLSPIKPLRCGWSEMLQPQKDFRRLNERFSELAGPDIYVIDPFPVLCRTDECSTVTPDGLPVYSDSDHLSVWGAELVVSHHRQGLESFVTRAEQSSRSREAD